MLLILLIPVIGSALASPIADTFDNELAPQDRKAHFPSVESNGSETAKEGLGEAGEDENKTPRGLKLTDDAEAGDEESSEERNTTQGRRHKAVFVDYPPPMSRISHYLRMPAYELDYNDNSDNVAERSSDDSKKYQESNVYYIRLPPTPYMFVPGLGYISKPPAYSAAAAVLKPQVVVPQLPQLLQPPRARPASVSQQTVNSFIKLPIDFVSNGKPTSVYQWRKKPGKKPADSPITNLDDLSADFVSNGKPTSIYQWQANLKPAKRPDDKPNSLDMGPYTFNGKLASVYLLGPDGSSSMHQPIRYSDYRNAYY